MTLPKSIAQHSKAIAVGMAAPLLPQADTGSRHLMPLLLQVLLGGASALAVLSETQTVLTTELILRFALTSGVIQSVCKAIALAGGANEKTVDRVTNTLACTAVLQLIHTIAIRNPAIAAILVEGAREQLNQWLTDVAETVEGMHSDQANILSIVLQQARMALSDNDSETFVQLINESGFFEEPGLKADSEKFHALIMSLWSQGNSKNNERQETGIIQG